ncbi:MAG: DNA/RNA non-specific endonuclease [Bacteroides sp.]|nr:DNA/RNA non-specific endonuclease [Bacteroides sp.]
MANKRRKTSNNKPATGVIILVAFLCLVIVGYEPLVEIFSGKGTLEQKMDKAVSQAADKLGEKLQEAATQLSASAQQEASSPKKQQKEPSLKDFPKPGTGIEIPAALKKRSELILKRKGYTTSYNREWKLPNWVAWELTPEKLIEREGRTNDFLPDPDLPEKEAVTTKDYKSSGYDRGHMCPAGDSRWHWKAMQESFYMTNMCPQNHKLNSGDWKELEEACRRWAKQEGRIYIVCGPILYQGNHKTIGKQADRRIIVPEAFFKVVLCMESNPPRAIGFIYKNEGGNRPMSSYVNSVDQVERITGIDFFPALPDEIEAKVEAACDPKLWKITD